MYIYINIYMHIYVYICIYFIEHYRHFCLHIFLLILSNCSIDLMIFGGNWLINLPELVFSPSTFSPTLDHHQGRVYYKMDVTFICILLRCKNERLNCYIV